MTKIETGIVGLEFDNKQFIKAIDDTIVKLGDLTKSLHLGNVSHGFSDITSAAQKVDVSSISAGIGNVSLSLQALNAVVFTVFRTITEQAIATGSSIAKSLTIEGAVDGFAEYEQKVGAVQLLMAGTGKSVDEVNAELERLNKYSDQTIYSFKEMTNVMPKFTNAGIPLEEAGMLVRGMSNLAALSGTTVMNANLAYTQIAQGISSGVIRRLDWSSIKTASMDTMDFKNELIKTAIANGQLKKTAEGTYQILSENISGGYLKQPIAMQKLFTEGLEYQWLTAENMQGTLSNFADLNTEIGRKSFKAATEVKTFTMMMATLKESIGSGWATTWENIIGNKDQATELFTDLGLGIFAIVRPSIEARNALAKFWNENGGREAVINGLKNVLTALGKILGPIATAFKNVFPPKTGEDLVRYSEKFEEFTKKLIPSEKTVINITRVFYGLFNTIKFGIDIVKFIGTAIAGFASSLGLTGGNLKGVFDFILQAAGDLGRVSINFSTAANYGKKFGDSLTEIGDSIKGAMAPVDELVNKIKTFMVLQDFGKSMGSTAEKTNKVGDAFTNLKNMLAPIGAFIKGVIEMIDVDKIVQVILTLAAGKTVLSIANFINGIGKVAGTIKTLAEVIPKAIESITGGITGTLKTMQASIKADIIKKIAVSILLLAAAMLLISFIDPERLLSAVGAVSLMMAELVGIIALYNKKIDPKTMVGMSGAGFGLMLLAGAILMLAGAVAIIGNMDLETLAKGLSSVAVMIGALGLFTKFSDVYNMDSSAGLGILLLAAAIAVLAYSMKIIASLSWEDIFKGLIGIGLLLRGLQIFTTSITDKDLSKIGNIGINLALLSVSVLIFAHAVGMLADLTWEEMFKGLIGIGLILRGLNIALNGLDPNEIIPKAQSLAIVMASLYIAAKALEVIANLSWEDMFKGVIGIGLILRGITLALETIKGPETLKGAATIAILSASLLLFSFSLAAIGVLPIDVIAKGLIALAIGLGILIAAGWLANGAAIGLAALALVIGSIGAAAFLVGAGLLMVASAMALIIAALTVAKTVMIGYLTAFSDTFPVIAENIAKAIGAFCMEIVNQSSAIFDALVALLQVVISAVETVIPQFLALVGTTLQGILDLLVEYVPKIVDVILTVLLALLDKLVEFVPKLVEKAVALIVAFLKALTRELPKVITAGADLVVALIKGIGNNMLKITTAAMDTIIEFVEGLTAAIKSKGPRFDAAAKELVLAVLDRIKALLLMPAYSFIQIGKDMANGIKKGIEATINAVVSAGESLVRAVAGGTKKESESKSPSKLFMRIATYWTDGMIVALRDNAANVANSARTVVSGAYSAMLAVKDSAADIFSGIESPTITPVVDLDGVYTGAKKISSIMSKTNAFRASTIVGSSLSAKDLSNGGSSPNKDAVSNAASITFNQTNNSPKTLSRIEIYRQTRNQLKLLTDYGV